MWEHGIGNNRRPTVSLARRRDQIELRHAGEGREGGRSEQGGRPFGADPSHSLLGGYLLIVLAP